MSNEYKDWLADTDAEIAYKMLHEEPLTEQEALRMARQEMCTEMFCVVEDRTVKRHRNDIYIRNLLWSLLIIKERIFLYIIGSAEMILWQTNNMPNKSTHMRELQR